MEKLLLRVFQRQVAAQCGFILRAEDDLKSALESNDVSGAFYALQNLLNAGANVAKALWGAGGKLGKERKPLRDSVGIADDSPLRNVTMRNNFEHFDERLDFWWKNSKAHNYSDTNLMTVAGLDETDSFRNFDPATSELSFWGQGFNVKAIVDEVKKIAPKLEEEAQKPHWDD